MNLQNPKKFKMMVDQAHEVALNVLRPISRKYDKAEQKVVGIIEKQLTIEQQKEQERLRLKEEAI